MTQEQRNKKADQLRLAAQIIETGCEWEVKHPANTIWCSGNELLKATYSEPDSAVSSGYEIRILPSGQIKEPVIPVPEGWRELSDGEKDGEWVAGAKYLGRKDGWKYHEASKKGVGCYRLRTSRVIVPVAKLRVPLEPCDIPPGTCIKPSDEYIGWGMICEMDSSGVHLGESRHLSFKNLMDNNWSIKRPTDTEWQPCSKEAES